VPKECSTLSQEREVTTAGRWAGRWVAAAAVAAAIAAWPACIDSDLSDEAGSNGTRANLTFALKDMDGKDVRLADFKGKPILLNFWATWCGPCKAEMPVFVDLVEKYKADGFAVLAVSIDDPPEQLQKFAARYKVNFPLLVGSGHDDLLETYEAGIVLPVSWLIRRDGTVAVKKQGTASREWFETQVKALF
jgi:peroxiredoxin